MMGNFFNRMYYGKGGNSDYTKDDLPDNRWQLFLAMARLNFGKLVQLNLMFVVFFIPLFAWIMINLQVLQVALEAGEEVIPYFTMFVYVAAPCLIVLAPATAGMTYITRNMARDQNVWIWSDFWYAIKQNAKQLFGLAAINAVALIVGYTALMFYRDMSVTGNMYLFLFYIMIVMSLVWICMNMYAWPMLVTYELSVFKVIKNSLILAIGRLPQTLFLLVITFAVPVIIYVLTGSAIAMLIGVVVYALIGFSLTSLAINSVTNSIFDKFINIRIKGARVNQGLRVEYDKDDDDGNDDNDDGNQSGENA